MSTRCTPFGLNAGLSVAHIGKENSLVTLSRIQEYDRKFKIDSSFLSALLNRLAGDSSLYPLQKYAVNPTAWLNGECIRYLGFTEKGLRCKYELAEIPYSPLLHALIKSSPKYYGYDDLIKALTSLGYTKVDSEEYIGKAIESKVLLSDASLGSIESQNPFEEDTPEYISIHFPAVQKALEDIRKTAIGQSEEVISSLETLKVDLGLSSHNVLHSVLYKQASVAIISQETIDTLAKCLPILEPGNENGLSVNPTLDKFKSQFIKRYGEKEVPLLEVLDPEIGIRYANLNNYKYPDLNLDHSVGKNQFAGFLAKRYLSALMNGEYEITINESDLSEDAGSAQMLSDTFSILFRIYGQDKDVGSDKIEFIMASGATAASMLGRFGHINAEMSSLIQAICAKEKDNRDSYLIAEINNLSQASLGNITGRLSFREYEITVFSNFALNSAKQISLGDLMVSVANNDVRLRSKALNRYILPKLSNAHNYPTDDLSLYQFLSDLQTQNTFQGLNFDWGSIKHHACFMPRVTFRNVVLAPASWQFFPDDIQMMKSEPDSLKLAKYVRSKYKLPRLVTINNGDQKLLVDFDSHLSCEMFLNEVIKGHVVHVSEHLHDENFLVKCSDGETYTNEVIVSFFKDTPKIGNPTYYGEDTERENDVFFGNEWVYVKVYANPNVLDSILLVAVPEIIEHLQKKKLIKKWFFVKYFDEEFHLRIRLEPMDGKKAECLAVFMEMASRKLSSKLIHKVQTDIYHKEYLRYGVENMLDIETYFYHDSVCMYEIIRQFNGQEDSEKIFFTAALFNIHFILEEFGLNISEGKDMLELTKNALAAKIGMGNIAMKLENDGNKELKKMVLKFLLHQPFDDSMVIDAIRVMRERHVANQAIVKQLLERVDGDAKKDIVISLIHMSLNRLFTNRTNQKETLAYDLVSLAYGSWIAINNKNMQ